MPVFALAPVAATAFWGAVGAGATAGGLAYGAHKQASSSEKAATTQSDAALKAAQLQSDAATKSAEIQAGSAKEALDFTKQQDVLDRASADQSARLNYGQWADQQRRIGTLGSMLGLGGRDPGPYESVINPSGSSGGGSAAGGGDTMPSQGEVDWTAAPQTLTQQLNAYFTKRGVGTTETPYWVSKAAELVARGKEINDPNYASTRLAQSDIFGGGGATAPAKKTTTPTTTKTGLGSYVAPYRAPNRYVQTPTLESALQYANQYAPQD